MSDLQKQFIPFEQLHNKDGWYGYTKPRMYYFNHPGIVPDSSFGTGFLVADEVGIMDLPHVHDGAYNFFIFTGDELYLQIKR